MNFVLRLFSKFFFLLILTRTLSGCNQQEENLQKKYSLYVMMKDGNEYIVQTDSLSTGKMNPETGAKVVPSRLYYDLIVKDGSYYRLDWKSNQFVKHQIRQNEFVRVDSLKLDGFSTIENYNWITPDSLLLIGYDQESPKIRYAKVAVKNMQATQGVMQIPPPFEGYNWMSVGFSKIQSGKLLVGYTYNLTVNLNSYTTSDTMYTEVLNLSDMQSLGRYKDTRSAYPGGVNTRQSNSFTDEKGDFHFISCPGIALGNNPNKPTGIFRINKSEERPDPDYFFNISASPINNHGYGVWYIGNGKAIVRTERKGLFTGMKDHYKVPQMDFYVIELAAKTVNRLGLPLDKGTARQCILVENGLVYITVNSGAEGNYVWIYNPKTGDIKKGMEIEGNVDYILRLDRLN